MQDAHGLHKRMGGIRVVEEAVSKAGFWSVGRRDKKTVGKTLKDADQIFAQQWIDSLLCVLFAASLAAAGDVDFHRAPRQTRGSPCRD